LLYEFEKWRGSERLDYEDIDFSFSNISDGKSEEKNRRQWYSWRLSEV